VSAVSAGFLPPTHIHAHMVNITHMCPDTRSSSPVLPPFLPPSLLLCVACALQKSDLLGLVAMTIAGFPSGVESAQLWLSLTRKLSTRLVHRHPYLYAVCCFLREQLGDQERSLQQEFGRHGDLTTPAETPKATPGGSASSSSSSSYSSILWNRDLDLSDRVGFACRFLDDREVLCVLARGWEDEDVSVAWTPLYAVSLHSPFGCLPCVTAAWLPGGDLEAVRAGFTNRRHYPNWLGLVRYSAGAGVRGPNWYVQSLFCCAFVVTAAGGSCYCNAQ
jgi:hypothetical protein